MPDMEVGPGGVATDPRTQACERTHGKKHKQKQEKTAWGKSGIISEHQGPIQDVATDLKVVIYFRQTKNECQPWIRAKHHPKPHSVLAGTTITASGNLPFTAVQEWLDKFFAKMEPMIADAYPKSHDIKSTSRFYGRRAVDYIGIVGSTQAGQDYGRPLPGFGKFRRKWITGDYDLFQVVKADRKCTPVCQDGTDFARLRNEINRRLKWPAIQHGPQAQWCPTKEELGDLPLFKMPDLVKEGLRKGTNPERMIAKGRKPMKAIDSPLTVVAGYGVISLEDEKAVRDALICEGCAE